MTFTSQGSMGTGTSKAAGTAVGITSAAQTANVGDLVIVCLGINNTQTGDGDSTDINSVADSVGNTYTLGKQYTNGQGGAQAGATAGFYYSVLTVQLPITTGTITADVDSVVAKAISAWRFTLTAGSGISVASAIGDVGDAVDPASVSISGLTSREYLFVDVFAGEGDELLVGYDSAAGGEGFTALDKPSTAGGVATSNIYQAGGFKIVTATSQAYDASTTLLDTDYAQVYAALFEVPAQSQAPRSMHQYRQRRI